MLVKRGEIPSPFFYHVFQIFPSFTARTIFSNIFLFWNFLEIPVTAHQVLQLTPYLVKSGTVKIWKPGSGRTGMFW